MAKHEKGSTIWIYATWKDKDGNAIEGIINHEITITDPAGTDKTDSVTVTPVGSGVYFFKYTIPAGTAESPTIAGEWHVKWKVTYGTDVGIEEYRFEVEE